MKGKRERKEESSGKSKAEKERIGKSREKKTEREWIKFSK